MDEGREARMTLAALSEPGDTIPGTLVARLGAAHTVQLISSDVRLPDGIDPAEGELWRRRLAPRINPGQVDRILSDNSGDRTFAYSPNRRFSRTGPDLKF